MQGFIVCEYWIAPIVNWKLPHSFTATYDLIGRSIVFSGTLFYIGVKRNSLFKAHLGGEANDVLRLSLMAASTIGASKTD